MSESNNNRGWHFIILILVLVLGLWFFYPFWSYLYKDYFYNTELSEMGGFGDSYGALNTLFSALAFTGIIASIYFQREELKATREELEATRYEMKNQGKQFEAQTKVLDLQVFENTFFNMLKLHNDIIESLSVRTRTGGEYKGRHGFKLLCEGYNNFRLDSANQLECIPAYNIYYIRNEAYLGHYFRVLYQIVSLVDKSVLGEDKKRKYVDILRAQFSVYELILLIIHALSEHGGESYKCLVEKYCLLEYISKDTLGSVFGGRNYTSDILKGYSASAYGQQREEISKYFQLN
ncbi:putative phage abortive infection protein [Aeromonas rivipollensis]|uniref:putative phage abortive infection protein n=1 Tax=Aeromonas rivipollensis TaxID=948519 RepID=UPI0038D0547A